MYSSLGTSGLGMIIEDDHGQCVCVWSNKRCNVERTISVIVSPQEMQSVSECEQRARPHYTISSVMITTGLNIMPPLPTQTHLHWPRLAFLLPRPCCFRLILLVLSAFLELVIILTAPSINWTEMWGLADLYNISSYIFMFCNVRKSSILNNFSQVCPEIG